MVSTLQYPHPSLWPIPPTLDKVEHSINLLKRHFGQFEGIDKVKEVLQLEDPVLITKEIAAKAFSEYQLNPESFFNHSGRRLFEGFKFKLKGGRVVMSLLSDKFERAAKSSDDRNFRTLMVVGVGNSKIISLAGFEFKLGLTVKVRIKEVDKKERIIKELELYSHLKSLKLPGILPFFKINTESFHLPFCPRNLNQFLLDVTKIMDVLTICSNLHRNNICHYDLKGSNFLVLDRLLYLIDFERCWMEGVDFKFKDIIGTLAYCCPYILEDYLSDPQNVSSQLFEYGVLKDAFSIGCIILERVYDLQEPLTYHIGLYSRRSKKILEDLGTIPLKKPKAIYEDWWNGAKNTATTIEVKLALEMMNPDLDKRLSPEEGLDFLKKEYAGLGSNLMDGIQGLKFSTQQAQQS